MSIDEAVERAEDAFEFTDGKPVFDPGIDSSREASDGKVQFQKACRLIEVGHLLLDDGEYYTTIVEHGFAAIERSLEGYLIEEAGDDAEDFRDHEYVYERGTQLPLDPENLESMKALYDTRRTGHYYGTTVSTRSQAKAMLALAESVHRELRDFEGSLEGYCNC